MNKNELSVTGFWARLYVQIFSVLLFPIRHKRVTALLVGILLALPSMYKVPVRNYPQWYKQLFCIAKTSTYTQVTKTERFLKTLFLPPYPSSVTFAPKKEKPTEKPKSRFDILKQREHLYSYDVGTHNAPVIAGTVTGSLELVAPLSVKIKDVNMPLFGIEPITSKDFDETRNFVAGFTKNEPVTCAIMEFDSRQSTLCYNSDKESLNLALVTAKFAKDTTE